MELCMIVEASALLISCAITSYPSPYMTGNKNISTPRTDAPTTNFIQGLRSPAKMPSNQFIERIKYKETNPQNTPSIMQAGIACIEKTLSMEKENMDSVP